MKISYPSKTDNKKVLVFSKLFGRWAHLYKPLWVCDDDDKNFIIFPTHQQFIDKSSWVSLTLTLNIIMSLLFTCLLPWMTSHHQWMTQDDCLHESDEIEREETSDNESSKVLSPSESNLLVTKWLLHIWWKIRNIQTDFRERTNDWNFSSYQNNLYWKFLKNEWIYIILKHFY